MSPLTDPGLRSPRLVIHSDRRLVREALAAYFGDGRGFTVVGHTGTGPGLRTLCELRRPELALVDVNTLSVRTVRVLRDIRAAFPDTEVVVAYAHLSLELLAEAVRSGLTSFVPSSRGLEAVLRLLRQRARRTPAARRPCTSDGHALTERELSVISLLSRGHTVSDIARALRISPHTVDNHKRRVYAKFRVGSQSLAVSQAMALGLVAEADSTDPAGCDSDCDQGDSAGSGSGAPLLVVVSGPAGATTDLVLRTVLAQRLPLVHVPAREPVHTDHWARWHRGPMVTVLVDPCEADWWVPASLRSPVLVVWSVPLDRATIARSLAAGARAVMPAGNAARDLPDLLSVVSRGYTAVGFSPDAGLADHLVGERVLALTPREEQILSLLASGHTIRQTARALGIAAKTVENTQARLYRKLGTHNRAETVAVAHRMGLLDDPERGEPSGL